MDEKHLGIGAHSDYVAAMKQTAEKNNVPLVDLYSMSRMELKESRREKQQKMVHVLPGGRVQESSGEIRG